MANRAIYPGSFDPVTFGHLDIISRAAGIFDQLYVAVLGNVSKRAMFTVPQRLQMLKELCASYPNVQVISFDGLLVDAAKKVGANMIVKGLRNPMDYQQETQMAKANRMLTGIETLFIPSESKFAHVSSSIVKELAKYGASIEEYVPKLVEQQLRTIMEKEKEHGK